MFDFSSETLKRSVFVKRESIPEGISEWIHGRLDFLPDRTQEMVLRLAPETALCTGSRRSDSSRPDHSVSNSFIGNVRFQAQERPCSGLWSFGGVAPLGSYKINYSE